MILYHMMAFALGYLLDGIIGDPYWMPHPIRLIGNLIAKLDQILLGDRWKEEDRNPGKEFRRGILLVLLVLSFALIFSLLLIWGSYIIHPYLGIGVEAILTSYCLAVKSLKKESGKVYDCLISQQEDSEERLSNARKAVSMIVGRDTDCLDEAGVIRASVETVAENASDGVIAPAIYLCLGGPVLGLIYKAINTMDSMVGYHNDKYEYFGKAAARLDDIANYLPSRMSAMYLLLSARLLGKEYDARGAFEIYERDRRNHKSPNSAQTESVVAGALGLRLAGPSYYFGKMVEKPYIGDAIRQIEAEDIVRANRMMQLASLFAFLDGEFTLLLLYILLN